MKKFIGVLMSLLVAVPLLASAHERQQFEINGELHEFVVGSLNEPIVVDDKTGLELSVREVHEGAAADEDHHSTEGAVAGLEETLKVEMIAGDVRKTTDISPVFGEPGSYKNTFYPTVATTFSYRIFGTIDETPFDYTFTCNPAGHTVAPEDKTRVEVSDKVFRVLKTGAFSCPLEKSDLGFPEASSNLVSLKEDSQSGAMVGWVTAALALVALALSFRRRS